MRLEWLFIVGSLLPGCHKLFNLDPVEDYHGPDAGPPCEPRDVAVGREHACAIDYRGRIRCWGSNGDGEAQPGGPNIVESPSLISLATPATRVTAGKEFSCAITDDQHVWCWGTTNHNEQANVPTNGEGPTEITTIPPAVEISAGSQNVCIRSADDGSIWCWGSNSHSESGQPTGSLLCDGNECAAPAMIPGSEGSKALAMGHRFGCAIMSDDRVACWGRNNGRQLGDGGNDRAMPTVVSQVGTVQAIAASGRTACALEMTGDLKCWGANVEGQLGTGSFGESDMAPVGVDLAGVRDIALSTFGTCALRDDRSVWCWGDHDTGEGTFSTDPKLRESPMLAGAKRIASHYYHSCAIIGSDLSCWGLNSNAELGRGARSIVSKPQTIAVPEAIEVVGGSMHACALTKNDGVYCWGNNDNAQAGNPSLVRYYTPTKIPLSITPSSIAAAFDQTCAWGQAQAQCWGRAFDGRLGTGDSERSQGPKTIIDSGVVQSIAIGRDHMCVLRQDSTQLACFGRNSYGQLGSTGTSPKPGGELAATGAIGAMSKVVAGGAHTCVLSASSQMWCWGRNDRGQLGNGGKNDTSTPQQVSSFGTVVDIGAGDSFSCALTDQGEVWCWGQNNRGQLGNGTKADSDSPVKALSAPSPGVPKAISLHVGSSTSRVCVRREGGSVLCWGSGNFGQLGNDMTEDLTTPTPIDNFFGAEHLGIGHDGTCTADSSGVVQCTGEWSFLANGDHSLSVPTPVDLGIGACDQ